MSIIREFTLYLHAGITTPKVIHANQYSQGETWIFKLLQDDGSVYVPSTGALIGVKADGHAIAGLTGTVLGDGRVSITTTQQLTAAAGDATCELTIDEGTNGSANFVIRVEKKPTDDAILSESDLSIIQEGLNSVTPAAIEEKVSDWLEENFTEPPVDQSLTIANAAADAKVTGDNITELKTAFESCFDSTLHNPINLLDRSAVTFGKYCTDTGAIANNESYWYTDYIPVEVGATYTRQRGTLTVLEGRQIVSTRWISCYDSNKNVLADKGASNYPNSFTVPSGVAFIRFSDNSYMDAVSNPTIIKGTEVLDYSEYFEPYTSRILKSECNNDEHINDMITDRMQAVRHTSGMVYEFNINSDDHELNDTNTLVEDMFGYSIQFDGIVTTFNGLTLGHGNGVPYGGYVKITPTHFEYYLGTEANPRLSEEHNLTISDYISVRIDAKTSIKADFTIYTNGGVYTKANQVWDARFGRLFVNSNGTNVLTGCKFAYMCRGWAEKVHLYGDSYFGVYNDKWTNYLTVNNWNKCNVNAYPGRASAEALRVAKNVLNHSKPGMIVWCLGMNDGDDGGAIDATWKACVDELMTICEENGIVLVLATIPNVPSVDNTAKNAYVRASGYRYIDFASAVGASSDTTWFNGMLSSDNVHPSVQGAIALFNQAISDVPELMQ